MVTDTLTYSDYQWAWQAAGLAVMETSDVASTSAIPSHWSDRYCRVICNPNNPDGRRVTRHSLLNIETRDNAWLIVDEAYGELHPEDSLVQDVQDGHRVVLRSFGKFFGLPGIRLGAVVANPSFIARLNERLGYWHVSTIALDIGIKAYRDQDWQSDHRIRLTNAARQMVEGLQSLDFEIRGHTALFFLLSHPDAQDLWHHLMHSGIYTRHFDQHPDLLRLGLPAKPEDAQRLFDALRLYQNR